MKLEEGEMRSAAERFPKNPRGNSAPFSPRRRRLRATVIILAAAGLLGSALAALVYFRARPTVYLSDEQNSDITSTLARNLPADAPAPRFTDVTAPTGLSAFRSFIGERTSQLPEDMGSGLAWGDFDNDGNEDLFLVSAGGPLTAAPDQLARCELYRNLGNGTFQRVEAFPDLRIHGMGAAWGDYDDDGFLDLAVSGYNTLALLHNENGTGRFVRNAGFADRKGFWAGVSWGDYDHDRRLDLYVCGYVQYAASESDRTRSSDQLGTFVPYTLNPSAYQPALNLLFHNEGGGAFAERAESLGVSNPTGRSLGALWHDLDDDGWADLYIANDVSDNAFYRNTGGGFEDISHAAWVADYRSAMGLAAGDYNRDGDDDLFITHWVAQENALYDSLLADLRSKPAAPKDSPATARAAGNVAEPNQPPVRFMDVNEMKGLGQIALPYVGWGTEFVDFDCDGWLDLVVANGSTLEIEGPVPRKLKPQEAFLFWNQRGEFFHNLAPLNKALSEPHVSRGLAVADYDNDGAVDVAMVHLGQGVQLLHNEMATGHWLKARLRSRTPNGAALGFGDGATVVAHVKGAILRRTVGSASYLSQSSRILHFGLGNAEQVDRLEIRWPGGPTNEYANLQANSTWDFVEGDPSPKRAVSNHDLVLRTASGTAPITTQAVHPATPTRTDEKARLVQFWAQQRAAMSAMKVEKDIPKAIRLFRAALELNPSHEDSRYYLGNCLAMQGDWEDALEQLKELTRINPQSHRGFASWGTLRAISAHSDSELAAAEESLSIAHQLNPEETGALLVLGELALLRGDGARAEDLLAKACQSNPKTVGGLFLRGYLAWKRGDRVVAQQLLEATRAALGKEWRPKGSTSEGDVRQKWHVETTPLSTFWEKWDGSTEPGQAFGPLEARLVGH